MDKVSDVLRHRDLDCDNGCRAPPHHVDWTAFAAVAALFSSFASILAAVFNPWIGYTKARLELLSEKLEKAYQLVKDETRTTI